MIHRSLFHTSMSLIILAMSLGQTNVLAVEQSSQLQLVNGDFLAGTLLESSTSDSIRWQSPAFTEPLSFPAAAVAAAHFPEVVPLAEITGDFAVELVGGNLLIGKLLKLTPEELVFESASFGQCRIAKNRIRRLVRWGEGSGIAYLGPHGLEGWTQQAGKWEEVAGHLVTNERGTAILAECKIPVQSCLEFALSWQKKPDFHLAIGVGQNIALESFQNLVQGFNNLAFNGGRRRAPQPEPSSFPLLEFETYNAMLRILAERSKEADIALVADLREGAGRVEFQVYVDSAKGIFSVYDMEGNLLTEVHVSPAEEPTVLEGISLTNRFGDVRLERLVVRNWNGLEPPQVKANQEFVQKSDGSLVIADSIRFDADQSDFVVEEKLVEPLEVEIAQEENDSLPLKESERTPLRLAKAEVVEVSFPSPRDKTSVGSLSLLLTSGERLTGTLEQIADGQASMRCLGFASPVLVPLDAVRSIVSPAVALSMTDEGHQIGRLIAEGVFCHGFLTEVTTIDQSPALSFRPQLSDNSSPLQPDLSAKLVYRDPPPEKPRPIMPRQQVRPRKNLAEQMVDIFTGKGVPPPTSTTTNSDDDQLLWLLEGDRIPCHLDRLNEEGIVFHTSLVEATFLAHEHLKAWEKRIGHPIPQIDTAKQARLLTLPRMQRGNPPLQLIESVQGDLLRARLVSMDDKEAIAEVRLDTKTLASNRIRRVIWLHPETSLSQDAANDSEEPTTKSTKESVLPGAVQALCRDGVRLTFLPNQLTESELLGSSLLLGKCRVDLRHVDQLNLGASIVEAAAELPYSAWKLTSAKDPQFLLVEGQPDRALNPGAQSPLIGQDAPDFRLKDLNGDEFRLSEKRGHIVVLDFWASWCGPCVQTMPLLETALAEFAQDQVELFAVNLQEDAQTIETALERMQIAPQVLLDIDGAAAGKYAVTAIPQTVIVDADGKIAAVLIGGGPAVLEQLQEVLRQVMGDDAQSVTEPAE